MRALRRLSGVLSAVAVAALLPISASQAATYFYHTDHLGTPQAITDKNQQVVWQSEQEPFGEVTATTIIVEQNLRFPGQYYDVETGLHYNYFRDYDAGIGRYVQSDPIGLLGGISTYAYVSANPLTYSDSLGLLVDVIYNRETGLLTVTDRDTGETAIGSAVSGGKPYGDPLPVGKYEILDQARNPEFFRLDPKDNNPGNDKHDLSGRTRFRLHKPGRTVGCIAVENQGDWDKIRDLINNTATSTVMDNAIPWFAPWRKPAPIKLFGELIVQ